MAAQYVAGKRLLTMTSPLGKDALLVHGFSGTESFSRLFEFSLDLMSHNHDIQPKDIVGQNVTVHIAYSNGKTRHFNGFISRFSSGSVYSTKLREYRAEMVPWLWFLSQTANCKVYSKFAKEVTTPDILEAVFAEFGFTDYKLNLKRTYPKWKYCVQYRETAFNYVSRLMEQAGMYYYFVHTNGKHVLHISDNPGGYVDCEEKSMKFLPSHGHLHTVTRWQHEWEFRPGKWAHTDYDFEKPSTPLLTSTNTTVKLPNNTKYEMFDYPGIYTERPDGEAEVKAHMEEDESPHDVVSGAGHAVTFHPGGKFTMAEHDVGSEKGKTYVLTTVTHVATDTSVPSDPTPPAYENTFTCIPEKQLFRPARVTPKPTVVGTQPAVVVGPKGQELHTDKYGRVMVQFFWDRLGKRDENSTCWIRVAQVMAGKRWGASFWPRIGQEVLVAFHEGDPDQPVVVGMLYNAEQMPPYQGAGPDGKHASDNKVSGFKSNTTMDGAGYNEWRFDDTKDKQQIFMHAEKDMDVRVKNDSRERIIHDRHLIVGSEKDGAKAGDQKEMVYQDKHLHVHRHQLEHIEGNKEQKIGFGKAQDGGNVDIRIEKEKKEKIGKDSHLHIVGNESTKTDGKVNIIVGADRSEKVGGGQSLTVGGDMHTKVGPNYAVEAVQEVHIKAGMKIIIEAGMQLSLVGPGGFVDIGPAGVTIQGMMVLINSGGAAGTGSGCKPKAPEEAKDAKEAKPVDPAVADDSKTGQKSSS